MGRNGRNVVVVPFLAPALLLYTTFLVYPALRAFYFSLTDWSGFGTNYKFIGLKNFREILRDSEFFTALQHNLLMLLIGGAAIMILAAFFAVLLWRGPIRGRGFWRSLLFSPSVVSPVAVAVTWSFVFSPRIGLLNSVLRRAGMGDLAKPWLGDLNLVLPIITGIIVWSAVGYYMVLFLAGLQRLPLDLYDAATVDGASAVASFFHITLPLMWDVIVTLVGLLTISIFKTFDIIWIMTAGGPGNATDVLATYMYRTSLGTVHFATIQRVGYGIAVAVVMFVIILVVTVASQRMGRRESLEY
jgi:ABC-type sugar transport system permease subunit